MIVVDILKGWLKCLDENMVCFGFSVIIVVWDLRDYELVELFDVIFLDVLCSVIGIICCYLDVLWIKKFYDIEKISEI